LWQIDHTGCQTYSDQPAFHAIALIGSHGWVEIAINGGNAQSQLQLDWGARVETDVYTNQGGKR